MKKLNNKFIAGFIAGSLLTGSLAGSLKNESVKPTEKEVHYYSIEATVYDLDRYNDFVSCIDNAGECWSFDGCEDWEIKDNMILFLCDNGTPDICKDDYILHVRYIEE